MCWKVVDYFSIGCISPRQPHDQSKGQSPTPRAKGMMEGTLEPQSGGDPEDRALSHDTAHTKGRVMVYAHD